MGKKQEFVKEITNIEDDFAQWYTDVVRKADLADYTDMKGFVAIKPYGYAIWENIQNYADTKFKEVGITNLYMPVLIPESMLQKEKDHVEGFAPECAVVTRGGLDNLEENLVIRPTSETLFCEHYSNIIQSYRDLPKLYNQWCSVVRWEKTTRPFLRTTEFLWQEGHTAHATAEDAQEETIKMLNVYADFCRDVLAIPVIKGEKTAKERFAGAKATYTIESLMHDGKALQSGTSHNFGDGFAKAFEIQYTDKNNQLQYVHQTSWGTTTRLIGAIIMVHGDNSGLVLPPKIAPTQVIMIPIAQHKEGVLQKAEELKTMLSSVARIKLDDSDKSAGWKFSEYEMKGVPIRLEIGPKDIEKNQVVLARRDTGEKEIVSIDNLQTRVTQLLDEIQQNLLQRATERRDSKTYVAKTMEEFERQINETPGFIKAMWCGDQACEDAIKEKTGATSRCIPFEQEHISDTCVCCGKPAKHMIYWGRAY